MNKTREQKRNELANDMCREIRFQMSNHGCIKDNDPVFKILAKWMVIAKKDKYERPITH